MKTLISKSPNCQLPHPFFLFRLPSLSWKNPIFINSPQRKWARAPKTLTFCSATTPSSPSCNGWDDLRLDSGESNQLGRFLTSLGIDDKKYIFVYLLGFVCALAISRVRVSSIIVYPACFIVFAAGFSIGFVNGGHMNELSLIGTKKRPKDEKFRISIEKLRNLMETFNGVDAKIGNLKYSINRGIRANQITISDLKNHIKAMESVELSALNGRNIVEGLVDSLLVENQEVERTLHQKSNKRKKEVDGTGSAFSRFISNLFRENSVGSKLIKTKDLARIEQTDDVNDHSRENIFSPAAEQRISSSLFDDKVRNSYASFAGDDFHSPTKNTDRVKELVGGNRRIDDIAKNSKINSTEMDSGAKRGFDSKENSFLNNELRFMNSRGISLDRGNLDSVETWASPDGLLDLDASVKLKHMRTEASFRQEQKFNNLSGKYRPSDTMEKSEKDAYRSRVSEERVIPEDDASLANHRSAHEPDFTSFPSSAVSDDIMFDRYLMEANILLKQARECLRSRGDEGDAENALYESARLLEKAIDMKPMSLLAVGQLGNTYLLHGELKLKLSRQLRALLSRIDPLSVERGEERKGLDDLGPKKEKVASALVNICEECEELLVMAGRKYRVALSIDGNDIRALYNWGLALSFRAQLIADIGPEAAFDADKVFLAAIDKFDAMMSKSNVYAPDALFRWGVALQQRSRLRAKHGKEKVQLLQQARRLYEDALNMDSNNPQVREALSTCLSELKARNY
ncbi:hypothetical protein RJ640_030119 [Escallonia rubra]|uniref:Uncharacterized protein n=1 Tax=Escallonia rubra TaxID=112253 RepID=A0AA88U9Z8_9ASTE|nr:hypothetical protein RJ640_030119 [Escallonia rubra]